MGGGKGDDKKKKKGKSNFVSYVSNFALQYNLTSASIALQFMDPSMNDGQGWQAPGWVSYTLLGIVFVGAMVGMTGMGYIGDLLGKRIGMLLTLGLMVIGCLTSALLAWGSVQSIYIVLVISRFIIGVGAGGVFPLSAAKSSESAGDGEHSGRKVGLSGLALELSRVISIQLLYIIYLSLHLSILI